jgi:hypothetical protein
VVGGVLFTVVTIEKRVWEKKGKTGKIFPVNEREGCNERFSWPELPLNFFAHGSEKREEKRNM